MNIQSSTTQCTVLRDLSSSLQINVGLERLVEFRKDLSIVDKTLVEMAGLVGTSSAKALDRHRKELAEFEPSVTVLGQVKAGKTALVNAMAGWSDLLPSDINPWTSVVTSLHLRSSMDVTETSARFQFLTKKEWDRLLTKGGRMGELSRRSGAESELQKIVEQVEMVRDRARKRLGKKFEMLIGQEHEYGYFDKNLLEKYICLGDDYSGEEKETLEQGRFAEILRSADLFLGSRHIPCNLCIRDTPGVNDTFMMREQITVQAVRESRLCLVTLSAGQALTSVDMGLIRLISNLDSRDIIIFVNRIDELSKPSEQIPEIEKSIRNTLRAKHAPEDISIVFGSAAWATAALSGDIEQLRNGSARALLDWAENSVDDELSPEDPNGIVWKLSGLPELFEILSDRIINGLGRPLLQRVCESAVTIATSQHALDKIRIDASQNKLLLQNALEDFETLKERHFSEFAQDLDNATEEYNARTDRAHYQFIERATQSLVSHLEKYGPMAGWKYDPTGLRLLVRSGYSVFAKRVQNLTKTRASDSLVDVAELYSQVFGDAVEGIQLTVPDPPDIPPPVSIGQTIALDFNDGWWMSWWKRFRGYDAFANQFRVLIEEETQDFLHQLKASQTDEVRALALSVLENFFADQRNILAEIMSGSEEIDSKRSLRSPEAKRSRDANFERIVTILRSHTERERSS